MVLRFANAIFEPLWNSSYIDHIQITCAENLGMEGGRGGYYDHAGRAARHGAEPPAPAAQPRRDGAAHRPHGRRRARREGQGHPLAAPVGHAGKGRRQRGARANTPPAMSMASRCPATARRTASIPSPMTEAYVAVRLLIDTWRWSGVPFYIRMGKRLPKKSTEISIHFKDAPCVLFNALPGSGLPGGNVLVIRIQPDEGISLRMVSKIPGNSLRLEPVKMDFHYATSFGKSSPEAYERLLLDAIAGDATLFARRDEVEEAWRFIDHIEHAWHAVENPAADGRIRRRLVGPAARPTTCSRRTATSGAGCKRQPGASASAMAFRRDRCRRIRGARRRRIRRRRRGGGRRFPGRRRDGARRVRAGRPEGRRRWF